MKLASYRQIYKNSQISHFVKIRRVGAELFHANGRTDRDKRTDRHDEGNTHFSQYCERA